ncbi:hypothetical protein AB0J86_21175 [Micromonospora sp. NPDC049559]|uniref:hypothetical protein n=1 Tax=Micromonospora sp. NPDC049559 TaxID=3155923 RepID=UPI003416314E
MFRKWTGRSGRREEPGAGRTATDPPVPAARTGADPPVPGAGLSPSAHPDYFGPVPHYATSPLPRLDPSGEVQRGTGIRKFVDSLPGLGPAGTNDLGNHLPVAVPDTVTYPGSDYYEIALEEYTQRMHRDLPATRLRGYRQINNGTDRGGHNTVAPPARPCYLGPVIRARRDRPVRVKFVNRLPTGPAGRLFLPVDPTLPGAGTGPLGGAEAYPQNRAVLHLAGATTAWISAGSARQWFAPAGEETSYPRGPGYARVPDMPDPGPGAVTLYYPNRASARLLWFHDQAEGIGRLNLYAGALALYLLEDPVERQLVADGAVPAEQIPLVIQDKTFVPDAAQLAAQDPTWDVSRWGDRGSLWFPHVYLPRQNPGHGSGRNPTGRWDYGPWCWPSGPPPAHGPVPNPYHDPAAHPTQPELAPGTPTPSAVPAAYLDTPVVNGVAYPYLRVSPRAYRLRILNACTERALNLQLYRAAADGPMWHPDGSLADAAAGEVPMVAATPGRELPPDWPTDAREGGVPDPRAAGPEWIQIGNEGGLLPAPVVLRPRPVDYGYDRRDGGVLNVTGHTLLLGPGERADVVVDFSAVPPGSNVILYNDCPAPMPAFDPRYDHRTGGPDRREQGGAPPTRPGWGPNTRTLLQFQVTGEPAAPFDPAPLAERLPAAYAASQPPPVVPQRAYDPAFGTATGRDVRVAVHDRAVTFAPSGGTGPVTLAVRVKTIQRSFDAAYGRERTLLGVAPPVDAPAGPGGVGLRSVDPPTEVVFPSDPAAPVGSAGDGTQLWRISNTGPETQFVHFQPGNVQVVNRVGWDGAIHPPDGNELGWKETVRIDPRTDVVVALRPVLPAGLPFKVGDSVRAYAPHRPAGGTEGLTQLAPETGQPATVTNRVANLGWEYAWQSQLLGHQEHDARRPLVLRVSPAQPTGLTATPVPGGPTRLPAVALVWTNNATRPAATISVIERATDATFTTGRTSFAVPAGSRAYTDASVVPRTTYHYRLRAENQAGYSAWSNTASAAVGLLAPSGLTVAIPANPPLRAALAWQNQSFATGVDIQRATNPTFTSGLATTGVPVATDHVDATMTPETTYYYRVRTRYLGAVSPWSNIAIAIAPGVPEVPAGLTATASVSGPDTAAIELRWRMEPAGATSGFVLHGGTDPIFSTGFSSVTVPGTARGHTVSGLARGRTYHYRLQALNPVGGSAFTGTVSVTTPA